MNYKKDLKIDLNHLEEEWLDQPSLFMRYAKACADARHVWEAAKRRLEVIKASIATQMRRDPESFHLDKVTEGAIEAAVTQHTMVCEATDELETSRHEMDILYLAKEAMEQRRDALQNAVRLHGQNYFAKPFVASKGRTEAGSDWNDLAEEKGDQKIQESLNKKKVAKKKKIKIKRKDDM